MDSQLYEVSGYDSRKEGSEAVVSADRGEQVVRLIVLNGCSNFEQLAEFGSLSKHFYELVSKSLESWRLTARNMSESGQRLTQTEANDKLLLSANDVKDIPRELSLSTGAYMYDPVVLLEAALSKYGSQGGLNQARRKRLKRKRKLLKYKSSAIAALAKAMCHKNPAIADEDARKLLKIFEYAMVGKKGTKEAASAVLEAASSWSIDRVKKFDNESLRKAARMWYVDCERAEFTYGHISTWDTSRVTDMSHLFSGNSYFNEDISLWNTSNVTNMAGMFGGLYIFNQAIGKWDTSSVTNMSDMFNLARSFNQPIGEWNTSNVINMRAMFMRAALFNQQIGKWSISKVTNMGGMFDGASSFNHPLGDWNTSNVTSMVRMFAGASSFNQSIGEWNTSNVRNMKGMFSFATAFNQPVGKWDTSNVTDMSDMFYGARSFNRPLGEWDTSNVTNMSYMFSAASSFNQPIGEWNTSNVTNMNSMFRGASSFKKPIGKWATSNVTRMAGINGVNGSSSILFYFGRHDASS